jgi:hypothetical protein
MSNNNPSKKVANIAKLADIASILAINDWVQSASLVATHKELKESLDGDAVEAILRMKRELDPSTMTLEQLRKECDEVYRKLAYARDYTNREVILSIICRSNYFPSEISKYEGLLGKSFALFFEMGILVPSELFDKLLRKHIPNFDEWKEMRTIGKDGSLSTKTNERNFFEIIWVTFKRNGLLRGGKKYGKTSKRRNKSRNRRSKKIR